MKHFGLLILAAVMLVALALAAYAENGPTTQNRVTVQSIVPKASKSVCTTIVRGRATQKTVDVSGTNAISYDVRIDGTVATAGTAEVVKRKLKVGSTLNTALMPAASVTDMKIDRATTGFVFERYSSGKDATLCYELN